MSDDALFAESSKRPGVHFLDARTYRLTKPIDMRNTRGVRFVGEGWATRIVFETPRGEGTLIDMTGSDRCGWEDVFVSVPAEHRPDCVFLLARETQDGDSSGNHLLKNVEIDGHAAYGVAEIGSEVNVIDRCIIRLHNDGACCWATSRFNEFGLTSSLGKLGGGSNVAHHIRDCLFGIYGAGGSVVRIGGETAWIQIDRGSWSAKRGARAAFEFAAANGAIHNVRIRDVQCESWGARNAVWTYGRHRIHDSTITGCWLPAQQESFHFEARVSDSDFRGNRLNPWWGKSTPGATARGTELLDRVEGFSDAYGATA